MFVNPAGGVELCLLALLNQQIGQARAEFHGV